jgi:peptidoglycan/LPS O-acetylase OafA/YrhL
MQPQLSDSTPTAALDYFDPSPARRARRHTSLRVLAGLLAIAAVASAANAWWNRWGLNWVCVLAVAVGVALGARATAHRRFVPLRAAWAVAAAVFALWSLIILINHYHGQPPPSDVYVMACCAAACALSVLGLSFDTRQPGAA